MRISDSMTYDQVKGNLGKNRTEMSELQNQAATQKRVTKPSDDPVAASRVLTSRVELQGNHQYKKNISYARSFLEYTDTSLAELTDVLVRVKELALNQANDASANKTSRKITATEVAQIYKQIVLISNRKLGERFLFGGYETTQAPFDFDGKYRGDNGFININIDKGAFVDMNLPGNIIFLGEKSHAGKTQETSQTVEEFQKAQRGSKAAENLSKDPVNRGPASLDLSSQLRPTSQPSSDTTTKHGPQGLNLFDLVKRLEVVLQTNDKVGIQNSLDLLDAGIEQVIVSRANVGSRVNVLDHTTTTLGKEKVDTKIAISQLEDADIFELISDLNKTEGTLKATLQTSGKIMQPSLMDFLR